MAERPNQAVNAAANSSHRARARHLFGAANQEPHAALLDLYQFRRKTILKMLHGITKNYEDAEDALQDSFLRALVHFDEFESRSTVSTWFTRIAINSGLMLIRKKRASREIPHPVDAMEALESILPDRAPSPESQYLQQERERILRGALQDLRSASRVAIEMRHLQELSTKESALAAGIPMATLKARLFHGKTALRRSLKLRAISRTSVRSGPR